MVNKQEHLVILMIFYSAIFTNASKEIINLGGIEEYSIKYANEILREIVGDCQVEYKEQRHEVKHSIPTWQKSVDILGFQHTTSLRNGLEQMWNWAKEQPMKEQFIWEEYELDKGIYKFWK